MKILVINGPNLNMLGVRDVAHYGAKTLREIEILMQEKSLALGSTLEFFQSNHEGEIIDTIQDERHWCNGIIINPGAFAHYSYAIRDAISSVDKATIEVHLSNTKKRESFRKKSVISEVCLKTISRKGKMGYLEGLQYLKVHI